MTHLTTEENIADVNAEHDPLKVTHASDSRRRAPLPHGFRGVKAEDMMGIVADAIDYEFLETVLGCRGWRVPKDIGI